jgi:predicted transcriptional regulator
VGSKGADTDEIVFLAIRLPKSLKRRLQYAALDEDVSLQALARRALEAELDRISTRHVQPRRR